MDNVDDVTFIPTGTLLALAERQNDMEEAVCDLIETMSHLGVEEQDDAIDWIYIAASKLRTMFEMLIAAGMNREMMRAVMKG